MMTEAYIIPDDFKVEFASPEWFDLLQKLCLAACRMGMMTDGIACEVYRDVPSHLAPSGTLAWTRRVASGSCSFEFGECPDDEAYAKLRADYSTMQTLGRMIVGDDDAEFLAAAMGAIETGKIELVRHDPNRPSNHLIHNLLAVMTR